MRFERVPFNSYAARDNVAHKILSAISLCDTPEAIELLKHEFETELDDIRKFDIANNADQPYYDFIIRKLNERKENINHEISGTKI